ncbi:conserved hypothetical membrane protein (DUF389) [Formosa agariphila KMM 3901]|uniref:Conserved hypothetical membrane protein (DUF389) n=1 Tax=Formosa agariphila (strain DSM 15362 / KCTC 12365 / LMG 23005 / KMM 3901 / M-2Alg 35-1) TaxID=1347342 RepID=T2KHJ4_FORAG|nr:DUF389 domain-containing protein [Formosa agariphila]CDF78307.1 conserved hypothetical membrane protein (DUF389) [Formosa agariphila KMM 3901]
MSENKFNFSEEEVDKKKAQAQDAAVEESKEAIKKDAKGLFENLRNFISEILDFRQDTDQQATIDAIKGDIPFKGATAWILVCSIFVASIGLNANSTAVVIGAMLISPLMGPILGIGLSVAINDIDTLKKSLINFGVMIFLSVLTAFLFYKFFPLQEESLELLARTKPDIRDVLIAFFGGAALIIARTKKGTIASVIFGVAIATALMPPLCTVGYGLAVSFNDFSKGIGYASGAFYLFMINTIFIALATFIALKILGFPMIKYVNSKKRKRISQIASLLAVVAMIPAIWTFIDVLKESNFKREAQLYLDRELEGLPQSEFVKKNVVYKYSNKEDGSIIQFNTYGLGYIPEETIDLLKARLNDYPALKNSHFVFNQNRNDVDNFKYMEQLRTRDSLDLLSQTQKIAYLEKKVGQLQYLEEKAIPFEDVMKEVHINYEDLDMFSYSTVISSNFKEIDTLPVFSVRWKKDKTLKEAAIEKEQEKLERWLKYKLKLDTLSVIRIKN